MRGGLFLWYIFIFYYRRSYPCRMWQKYASGSSHESQYGSRDKSSRIQRLFIKLYGVFTILRCGGPHYSAISSERDEKTFLGDVFLQR